MHIFRHIFLSKYWWQRSDIWSQASYRYPISWEAFLDPSDSYFLFADSTVAEKNATKNEHICSMCIKINKVGKQEVGIRWVQKRFPRYGVPIWSLWPNIRFLSSIVAEKNVSHFVGSIFWPVRFLLPVCRFSWLLYTFNIYAHFSSHFSQQLLMRGTWLYAQCVYKPTKLANRK
jgi:hypothetical protein